MDFGQTLDLARLERIHWSLPSADSPEEQTQLERLSKAASRTSQLPRIDVGVPIWNHAPWVGTFYPPGTSSSGFLKEYSAQFSTVELNSTFYAIPQAENFQRWKEAVSEDFRFCPKVPKSISHSLNGDHPDLCLFIERVGLFENRLGVCFLQFPSHVGPDQKSRIQSLFAKLPRQLKTVVEFRHPGFFQDQRLKPEWIDLLAKFFLGTACVDTPLERAIVHTSLSSTRVLIRFLGANRHSSNEVRFQQWAERIALWMKHGMKEVYFVVHEPDNTFAPESARDFMVRLNSLLPAPLKEPLFHSLF